MERGALSFLFTCYFAPETGGTRSKATEGDAIFALAACVFLCVSENNAVLGGPRGVPQFLSPQFVFSSFSAIFWGYRRWRMWFFMMSMALYLNDEGCCKRRFAGFYECM